MAPRSARGAPRPVKGNREASDCRGFALLLSLLVLVPHWPFSQVACTLCIIPRSSCPGMW